MNLNGMVIYGSMDIDGYNIYSGGTFSGTLDDNGYENHNGGGGRPKGNSKGGPRN